MSQKPTEVLFAEERREEIVRLINERGKVLVPELTAYFNVSPATVRSDLRDLESLGRIKRTHGGAIPGDPVKVGYEPATRSKQVQRLAEKCAIAREAAALVEDGDILILDTGTTLQEMAKLLGGKKNLTVIVNDLETALLLEAFEGVTVIVIGGVVRKHFGCTVGPFATAMLSGISVDKVFLGTNAFTVAKGATTPDINQAEVKKKMLDAADRAYLLCDSGKLGTNAFMPFAGCEDLHVVITDSGVDPLMAKELTDSGIELRIAGL